MKKCADSVVTRVTNRIFRARYCLVLLAALLPFGAGIFLPLCSVTFTSLFSFELSDTQSVLGSFFTELASCGLIAVGIYLAWRKQNAYRFVCYALPILPFALFHESLIYRTMAFIEIASFSVFDFREPVLAGAPGWEDSYETTLLLLSLLLSLKLIQWLTGVQLDAKSSEARVQPRITIRSALLVTTLVGTIFLFIKLEMASNQSLISDPSRSARGLNFMDVLGIVFPLLKGVAVAVLVIGVATLVNSKLVGSAIALVGVLCLLATDKLCDWLIAKDFDMPFTSGFSVLDICHVMCQAFAVVLCVYGFTLVGLRFQRNT